jgi:DNA mismatch repair protein MutS2
VRSATQHLEFDRLREIVGGYATCPPGRRHVAALAPGHDRGALEAAFALIREATAWLRAGRELGLGALADPDGWLPKLASPLAVLEPAELLDAVSLLETAQWLRAAFDGEAPQFPLLAGRARSLGDFRKLAAEIRNAILPNGEISDDASRDLRRIRTTQTRTREGIQKKLNDLLRARGSAEGDAYVTIRNDRFVIPVRAADRKAVQGVVHGASATGQTVFVEPFDTIEMNNRLVQLSEEEAEEIQRILRELTSTLQMAGGPIRHAAATLAEVDSLFARGRYAREYDCAMPQFVEDGRIRLEAARHPVLEANLRRQQLPVVPLTFALGAPETVMVISGPNTGGKTVALKTTGLAALAAQSAIPVPAGRAELPLFDQILVDIGDEQSIAANLSTFSAHMTNLRTMLAEATARSLVLVDEMGTGTAPEEGAALAVALLEEFRGRGCLTLATTHHDRLKAYASTTAGILNAAVEFDDVNLRPTYRLLVGVPGVSSGIAIAQRLGLPAPVLERARAEMDPQVREAGSLIAWLHRSRDELEEIKRAATEEVTRLQQERRKLHSDWAEQQRVRLAEIEKQFAATARTYEQEIARLVGAIKDRDLRAQMDKRTTSRLRKLQADAREETNVATLASLAEAQRDLGIAAPAAQAPEEEVTPAKLVAGARLRVRGLQQPVVLRNHDGRVAEIQAGPLRMKVKMEDVVAVVGDDGKGKKEKGEHGGQNTELKKGAGPAVRVIAETAAVPDEIDVIGLTVEQATEKVDKLLDQAALAGKQRLRIIHGHGTGALRRGLGDFLRTHPLVSRQAHEDADHGGTAITIVELRS